MEPPRSPVDREGSHTNVRGRYALRVAIGNLRTTLDDVRVAWELIVNAARQERLSGA